MKGSDRNNRNRYKINLYYSTTQRDITSPHGKKNFPYLLLSKKKLTFYFAHKHHFSQSTTITHVEMKYDNFLHDLGAQLKLIQLISSVKLFPAVFSFILMLNICRQPILCLVSCIIKRFVGTSISYR